MHTHAQTQETGLQENLLFLVSVGTVAVVVVEVSAGSVVKVSVLRKCKW